MQPDLCQTCSETTLLVFPRGGSNQEVAFIMNLHVLSSVHSYIHRQNIAPMELAQLGNKSQKISCSFQPLSSLSVNCENNKSNSLQVYDIRFLEVLDFFFSLGPFCVRNFIFRVCGYYIWLLTFAGILNLGALLIF